MSDGALLAQLMAQGQAAGADLATLRALEIGRASCRERV